MEIIIKVIITITVLLFSFKIIYWTWTSHIDPKTTIQRYISKKPKIADAVVTRDPTKIYQNSDPVGNVTGSVKTQKKQVIFAEITDTATLNHNEPFEYQRMKLKIVNIEPENMIGMKFDGPVVKKSVVRNVICEKVEE